jgi:DNA-binding response OmpR family regulator
VDSHAVRLRQKLYRPGEQRLLVNVWGVGWRLADPPGLRPGT